MDKQKIIPLILIGVLVLAVIIILVINKINQTSFKELIVSYQNESLSYKDLDVDNVIVVNNISFWIVSKTKNQLVIKSSSNVTYNNKELLEIELNKNKSKEICFNNKSCALFEIK